MTWMGSQDTWVPVPAFHPKRRWYCTSHFKFMGVFPSLKREKATKSDNFQASKNKYHSFPIKLYVIYGFKIMGIFVENTEHI